MNTKLRQKAKTDRTRNYLVSEPNYHTTKFFKEKISAIEMKETKIFMNKSIYLGLSKLNLSKTVKYEFWYDYVKPKYGENAKLCYMGTDSFIVDVKAEDIYKDIVEDVETIFDTSNLKTYRSLPKGKSKKVIEQMKDELGGQINKEIFGLRAKTNKYLKDYNDEDKNQKAQKSVSQKEKLNFKTVKIVLKQLKLKMKLT